MPFTILRNDITKVKADAIVNSANPEPIVGAGADHAIYEAAGADKLLAERKKIGEIARGDVAVTPAFNLNAKYIIHTVGPIWKDGDHGEFDVLRSCYEKSLKKAEELNCKSVAFPLISTGVYGFPKDEALQIATSEITRFLLKSDSDMTVKLVVFDPKSFVLSRTLFSEVASLTGDDAIMKKYREEYGTDSGPLFNMNLIGREHASSYKYPKTVSSPSPFKKWTFDKKEYMKEDKDALSFSNHFFDLILKKGLDNVEVYKKANVSKGAFSKIQCGDTKRPQKRTILAFCIGMKLSVQEAETLLASADMAFNPYDKRDRLVIHCLENGRYNINDVNLMLYECNQPLLGG